MKKCKTWTTLLLAISVVNFCLVSNIFAQVSDLLKQNSIQGVALTEMDGSAVLVFSGNLQTLRENDVVLDEGGATTSQFTVIFSNSLWDSMDTGLITETFNDGDPVSSVEIENKMEDSGGGEAVYKVVIRVNTREPLTPEIVRPFSASEIRLRLAAGGSGLPEKTLAQETQDAVQQQARIEEAEQQVQMEVKETVDAIIQQYRKPSIMQVSIFNASGYPKRAYGLSIYLGKLKKEYIEESLGMKMEIVNISNAQNMNHKQSSIYFRRNYLKPALFLAKLIKGDQRVIPYKQQQERQGVDIEIYLGKDYK